MKRSLSRAGRSAPPASGGGGGGGGDGLGGSAPRYEAMARLSQRAAPALAARNDLTPYEARVFSQNGEDGVIAEVLTRIGAPTKWFVEFGAGRGAENNCVYLADVLGWNGLFLECDDDYFAALEAKYRGQAAVRTVKAMVTPATVEGLFEAAGVPEELDVLSIDVDGADWWIWRAILRFRPRLVVTEYNSNIDLDARVTVPEDVSGWDGTSYFGASLGAFEALAATKGYRLVHCDLSGVNAFWVRDDLFGPFETVEPPRRTANYWLAGVRMPPPDGDRHWVDIDAHL